jgi:PAS domain S-box-containing protein
VNLLQNKQVLNTFLNHINKLIICLSANYNILYFNRYASKIYNWKTKEMLGKNYLTLCKKNNFPCPINKKSSKRFLSKAPQEIETIISNKTTDKKTIILWDIMVQNKKNKQFNGFILLGEDVTTLREQEDKIYQLDSIIAHIPSNVYWYDTDWKYLGCNENSAKTIGLPRDEIIGQKMQKIMKMTNVAEEMMTSFIKDDLEVMSTGMAKYNIEEPAFNDASGTTKHFLSNKVALLNQSKKVIGLLGISTDITERKKMEQELIKAKEQADIANKAKSNFLAVMSHELRTPLNAILGIAQVICNKELPPAQAEQVDIILRAGDFLLALIDDILDFSKLEAGKLDIIYQKFDFYQLIQDIAISMRQLADNKGLQLIVTFSKNVPHKIVADQRRVRQIIMNFINNAVKFTNKGHVKLAIKFNKRSNKIRVSVEDTGIGIPKSKLRQVFERFTQLDSRYSRRYGGAGLGLAICKQLVETMQGKIGVNSEYHKGSKFWFNLPLTLKPTRGRKVKEDSFEINDITPVKPGHILLLEDNDLNQIVVKAMLEDLDCTLDIVDNGKAALKLFEKQQYDLIFSDISLPDMSGIDVIQAMRKQKKHINSKKPIIAVTAHVLEEDINNCLNSGADDVLTKPIIQPKLKTILRRWIK